MSKLAGYSHCNTRNLAKNNSQLHFLGVHKLCSDTPTDHTSTMANCLVLIVQAVKKSLW